MIWQDAAIAISQVCFGLCLIPSMKAGAPKPPIITSAVSSVGMWVIVSAMFSLAMWFSFAAAICGAVAWTVLFGRTIVERNGQWR